MNSQPQTKYTPAEYLALEREAFDKHEYFDGVISLRARSNVHHVRISGNICCGLLNQLDDSPYEPFSSDMRVKVSATGFYTYPDVSVACAPQVYEDAEDDVLLNPRVLFEVLSPSTERRDRTFKFRHYQQIPSVSEIVFVTQDAPNVERFVRGSGALWQFDPVTEMDGKVTLDSIGCTLTMAQIYQGVEFPPAESPAGAQKSA